MLLHSRWPWGPSQPSSKKAHTYRCINFIYFPCIRLGLSAASRASRVRSPRASLGYFASLEWHRRSTLTCNSPCLQCNIVLDHVAEERLHKQIIRNAFRKLTALGQRRFNVTPLTKESCLRFTGSLAKAYPWLMPVSTLACPHCWHAWLGVGIMKTAFSPIRLGSMRWVTVRQSNSKNSSCCAANLHDAPIFYLPQSSYDSNGADGLCAPNRIISSCRGGHSASLATPSKSRAPIQPAQDGA